jgi:hypothetical protein
LKVTPLLGASAVILLSATAFAHTAGASALPVRGLYLGAPKPDEVPLVVNFIREALPREGVNTLVMEFDYRYQYTSHPEVVDADALSKDDRHADRGGVPRGKRAADSADQPARASVLGGADVRPAACPP